MKLHGELTRRILVVEDDPSVAHMLCAISKLMVCETRIVDDGKEVLPAAIEWRPDLITLDLMIPPPDGAEVLRRLKKNNLTKDIPVLVISGTLNSLSLTDWINQAQAILKKPVTARQIMEKIDGILDPMIV